MFIWLIILFLFTFLSLETFKTPFVTAPMPSKLMRNTRKLLLNVPDVIMTWRTLRNLYEITRPHTKWINQMRLNMHWKMQNYNLRSQNVKIIIKFLASRNPQPTTKSRKLIEVRKCRMFLNIFSFIKSIFRASVNSPPRPTQQCNWRGKEGGRKEIQGSRWSLHNSFWSCKAKSIW